MKRICYKILVITVFVVGILFINNLTVNAAAAGISASSKEVQVGDNVSVNVSINAVTWNIKVNGSGISDTIVGGNLDELANKSTSKTYKFDTSKPGIYTISLSGDVTDARNGDTTNQADSVTIKVSEKGNNSGTITSKTKTTANNNGSSNNSNSNNNNSSNKSNNDNSNKTTTQEPTFTASNKTAYATGDINVRSSYSSSSSAVGSLKKGDSVTIIGVGSNGWSKVTYNGKTAYIKSDLLTSTKPAEDEKSANKALKSLEIESVSLEPEFNKETTNYSVTVGKDVDSLKINAQAEDEKAKVTIAGNEQLKIGENTIKISVTAEDGTVRTYTVIAKKQEKDALGLESLKISGVSLNKAFNPNTYEYTVDLKGKEDLTKLDITAKANIQDATVEIIGNENFIVGENVVTIMVKSKDGKENVTYQILVNKPEKGSTTTEIVNENTGITNSKMFLYVAIGIFSIALLLIIIIIVRSIKKSKEEDYDSEDAYGFNYSDDNNITEELYGIRNNKLNEEDEQPEISKTKLYDVEKEVDFSEEERKPRKKGKHSK